MIKILLIGCPIIYWFIYIDRYIYILIRSHKVYSNRVINKSNNNVLYLTFKDFKNLFHVNPNKWTITDVVRYKTHKNESFIVNFTLFDYFKVFHYLSKIKNKSQNSFNVFHESNLKKVLEDVQKDINKLKKQSKREFEQGMKGTIEVSNRIKEEVELKLNSDEEDKADAFMYEQFAAN